MDTDLGLMVLRLALGPMLLLHGWNKIAGPGGLGGTERWFASIGMRPARLHARVAAGMELILGALVTLGLLTAPAAAGVVGIMLVAAMTDHHGKGFFVFKGGWEYTLVVALAVLALAAAGPGSWSLDDLLELDLSGAGWAVASAALGLSAGLMTLWLARGSLRAAPPSV